MVIFHLVIAHLLGDFVFQPNSLIKWKLRSWRGVFVHAFVISLLSLLLVFPYLGDPKAWLLIFFLGLTHFAQDNMKVGYQKLKSAQRSFLPFFLDQVSHVFFIWLFGTQFVDLKMLDLNPNFEFYYTSVPLAIFINLAIFFTFAADIILYEAKRLRNPNLKYHRDTHGIWARLIAFTVSYALLLYFGL
jgi:hypothetical protein